MVYSLNSLFYSLQKYTQKSLTLAHGHCSTETDVFALLTTRKQEPSWPAVRKPFRCV